jgi:hypothetical protein
LVRQRTARRRRRESQQFQLYTTVRLAEFDALRQEMLVAIQHQIYIPIAISGFLLAGASLGLGGIHNKVGAVGIVFILGSGVIAALGAFIWIGEVDRMFRIGSYLKLCESDFDRFTDHVARRPPLYWERGQALYTVVPHSKFAFHAQLACMVFAAAVTSGSGVVLSIRDGIAWYAVGASLLGFLCFMAALLLFYRARLRLWWRCIGW